MKTKVQQFTEGVGGVKLWGFSPAVDLSSLAPVDESSQNKPLDVLCMFQGDISSTLLTMSRLRRHAEREHVHVYLMEQAPEVLARHLLLLSIFIDPDLGEIMIGSSTQLLAWI